MVRLPGFLILLSLNVLLCAIPCCAEDITFEQHVRPILKAHCYLCHGEEEKPKGKLDLRLPSYIKKGGKSGAALQPGKADQSLLWQRIESDEMPEGLKKLNAAQKAIIRKWIEQGGKTLRPEPADPAALQITEEDRQHWAFQPIKKPAVPMVPARYQARTHIDAFIANRLNTQSIPFSPEADRRTWLRRVSFDLIGLPPSLEEIRTFLDDASPQAYDKVVHRLLQSPHYGERWGRHWLDVAGYSESEGTPGNEGVRPYAWKYRDYVIKSFHDDKPFDLFIQEQLAGDEMVARPFKLSDANVQEKLIATGFLRMGPDATQMDNSPAERNQAIAETIKIVSSSLFGLTVGCAQCHDHRYDPISHKDYYRFRAVFDPALDWQKWQQPNSRVVDATDEQAKKKADEIEAEAKKKDKAIDDDKVKLAQEIFDRELKKLPEADRPPAKAAIETPADKRSAEQIALLKKYPNVKELSFIKGFFVEYDPPSHKKFVARQEEVTKFRATKPPRDGIHCLVEPASHQPKSVLFHRGDHAQPRGEVTPGDLTILALHRTNSDLPIKDKSKLTTGRRLTLAKQLTDGTHPLVARVIVNRVWLHHFGTGLVNTPGDFGVLGEKPSHPELLDWLANDFMEHGWKLKRLHEMIVLSTTYRQQSKRLPELEKLDPDNRLLARMSVRRLEAEAVRDALLSASGQLNTDIYGPSVPVTEDYNGKAVLGERMVGSDGLFTGSLKAVGQQDKRRSIYLQARRRLPYSMLDTFDFPMMTPNCDARRCSTVPTQALFFLNDSMIQQQAEQLADRLLKELPDDKSRIARAFELLFAQSASAGEIEQGERWIAEQSAWFAKPGNSQWIQLLKKQTNDSAKKAWAAYCQVLMSTNRFLYVE
ncbi:MAG: PSD1 domain-containing protein [Planctomycetia bacterium]|nr:PSD1 domain-containing protein [Planctomycetia bacterium]